MVLTNKEKEIFELNIQGLSRKEICQKLGVKRSTLQTHLNNMAAKFVMPENMNAQYFFSLRMDTTKTRKKEKICKNMF